MLVRDRLQVGSRKKLPNGFLQVDATFARTGIQLYRADELGVTDRQGHETIRVWRPAEEVFADGAMATFAMVPLTDNHPADLVTADNAKELTRGWSGESVTRDGDLMKGRLIIADGAVIRKIEEQNKVELSNGYQCDLEWTSGTTPGGEAYDAIQRNIRGNHIALVDAGRCGPACRISDGASCSGGCGGEGSASCNCDGEGKMADKALKKIMVDGAGLVEVTDEAEAVIGKLLADCKALGDQLSAKDGEIAAKDKAHADALAAKDAEIAAATAKIDDAATLDARVAARTQLIADAKKLDPEVVTDGKTDLEVQKAAVTKKLGDEKVKDKPDTFFSSAFDTLVAMAPEADDGAGGAGDHAVRQDALRDALRPDTSNVHRDAKTPSYEDRMAKRWKGKEAA